MPEHETTQLALPVEGMTCASCAARVERKLNELEGVQASVNYATERATVTFDPTAVEPERLLEAVADVGYRAELPRAPQAQAATGEEPDPTAPLRRRLVLSALLSAPVLLLSMV
ncbi:MAG: cation transporter, partial [Pseudonocardiaceae bacterium]